MKKIRRLFLCFMENIHKYEMTNYYYNPTNYGNKSKTIFQFYSFCFAMNIKREYKMLFLDVKEHYRVFQQVLNRNLAKNLLKSQKTKNSWDFVYVLAKHCRCPFNLTNFLGKNFQILISRILGKFLSKTC